MREFLCVKLFNHFKTGASVDAFTIQSSRPKFEAHLCNLVSAHDIRAMIRHGPLSRSLFRAYAIWAKPLVVFVFANNLNR